MRQGRGRWKEMRLWLKTYEDRRFGQQQTTIIREPKIREPNPDWISNKYDLQDDWRIVREIYLPTIQMKLGPAVSRLKKLWRSYKASNAHGETTRDTAWKINQIEAAIGLINPTKFAELEGGMEYDETQDLNYQEFDLDSGLTPDELSAKEDELAERRAGVSSGLFSLTEDIWPETEEDEW